MKICICTNEYTLISSIEKLSLKCPSIISIDGVDGVGKSTLACKMAKKLNFQNIEIDTFVQAQQGAYINFIDYDRLNERIRQTIIANQVIIAEGICIQQILNKLSLNSYAKVYVKVIDKYGLWMDQIRYFPPAKTADEIIAERKANGFSLGHLEDIIRYHYTIKPHENADYIFERRKA